MIERYSNTRGQLCDGRRSISTNEAARTLNSLQRKADMLDEAVGLLEMVRDEYLLFTRDGLYPDEDADAKIATFLARIDKEVEGG